MRFFLSFIFTFSLYAQDINTLVLKAYQNNPTIQKLQNQIESTTHDIANSDLYKNPSVTIGLNDINLDEPDRRDIEAMQTNFISISQEITDSDKLNYKKQIELSNQKILQLTLNEQKNILAKNIYNYFIDYQQLEKRIQLNNQKIENIDKTKDYHTNHMQYTKAFQEILNNDLTIDKLQLQVIFDQEKQKQILIELSELINEPISNISFNNFTIPKTVDTQINEHTLLLIEKEKIQKATFAKKLADENQSSDYMISAGYYNRDSFDDYVSVALTIPLNIYGKEKNESLKARKNIDIAGNALTEVHNRLEKRYKLELSKKELAQKSLSYIDKINEHLLKQKDLIVNNTNFDSLLEVLMIENKILDNEILQIQYKKELENISVELAYLTSHFKEITHE